MENEVVIYPNIKVYHQNGYITLNNLQYALNQPITLASGTYTVEITLMWEYDLFGLYIIKSRSIGSDKIKERLTKTNKRTEYTYHNEITFTPGTYYLDFDMNAQSQRRLKYFEKNLGRVQKHSVSICKGAMIGVFAIMLLILALLYLQFVQIKQSYIEFFILTGIIVFIFGCVLFSLFIYYLSLKKKVRLKKEDLIPLNINIGTYNRGIVFWLDVRKEKGEVGASNEKLMR